MRKILFTACLFFICSSAIAEDIATRWKSLNSQYLELISNKKYIKAADVASELNKIDPADTKSMLYMVFAYIKAGEPIPDWLLNTPWPNATAQDVFNRQLAEQLVNGR